MKITALMENTAKEGLLSEHGLSLFIEWKDRRILFDAGETDGFLKNAEALGIDVGTADLAILSHGHYDHGGGMVHFLEATREIPLYINENAFSPAYSDGEKFIGLDERLKTDPRVIRTGDVHPLGDGLTLLTCNEKGREYPSYGQGLTREINGIQQADDFIHEQYLLIEEDGKRVLISGCSHKGIENIMAWLQPDVLIGGFHFMKLDPDGEGKSDLLRAAKNLSAYETEYYTCHCTGEAPFAFLKQHMGAQLHYLSAGDVIEI